MSPLRIVAVSAGLGEPSSTRLLADRLTEAVVRHLSGPAGTAQRAADVEVTVVDLREHATAVAHHMVTGFPGPGLRAALENLAAADGVVAVTPVFSASYSGLFKSFFDVVDGDALTGKPVLVAATGGTARHSLVLEHAMRPLFAHLRALVVPTGVFAASEDWGGGDRTDELAVRIDRAGRELAGLLRGRTAADPSGAPGPAEAGEPPVTPFEEQLAALHLE
jgi:FMN reductase